MKLSYVDADGNRQRPAVYVKDPDHTRKGYRECQVKGARLLAELLDGDPSASSAAPGTVGELLDRWLAARKPRIAAKTYDVYDGGIRRIRPLVGDIEASDLSPADLDDAYVHLETRGGAKGRPLSPNTVLHSHRAISAAYNWAIRRGEQTSNPAELADPPKPTRRIKPPDAVDVMAIEDLVEGVWQTALFRMLMTMGSRRGEFLGIRWSDIDFAIDPATRVETATVRRHRSVTVSSEGVGVKEGTKTGVVPAVALDPDTTAAVKRLMNHQRERALAAGVPLDPDPWLFASARVPSCSQRPSPEMVKSWWKQFRKKHPQFKDVQLRDLRDFVATQWAAAGVPIPIIAARLGHSDAATTLRRYTGWVPAADVDAAQQWADRWREMRDAQEPAAT
ncbi:MAG: site-specific integrase [Actinomycetota bacterium]